MPENEFPKIKTHPFRLAVLRGGGERARVDTPQNPPAAYVELAITTNYTFLTGASHPEEFVQQAQRLGHHAVAIADTNTLAGIVRAHEAAKDAGLRLVVGCRLRLAQPDSFDLLVYPTTRAAYSRLCTLLTIGKRRAPKGECHPTLDDVALHGADLLAVYIPTRGAALSDALGDDDGAAMRASGVASDDRTLSHLGRLRAVFDDDRLSIAAWNSYLGDDAAWVRRVAVLATSANVPMVAINNVHYHDASRRALQDVLTCVRHGCTVQQAGFRLHANAERHLKPADEMARLFREYPGAVGRSVQIAERALGFNLDQLRYEYPTEPCPEGLNPATYLAERTWAGAAQRYSEGVSEAVRKQIADELAIIAELKYEPYFLTCYDIVRFARERGILCQGRGGAANSAVCYCLGITEVDPSRFNLLFARFISRSRNEPPDIDIDFEHERREEVIQYLYQKYGRERAALTAEVISYRGRSAVRDVGKALGLSLDCVDTLAKHMDRWRETHSDDRVQEAGMNPDDPTIRLVLDLTEQLIGFPRHLSQHVGGFVITRTPLSELVPIENAAMEDRTVIEWDKDDIDAMGMLKVDVLGLGMLTCIRKAFDLVKVTTGDELSIHQVMTTYSEDPAVYDMIQKADTIGVFQIESRAQMSMLPRLKPATFYDLVIEVAIVRPGPIQGKMVHPYLRRRNREEAVHFPSPEIERVLGRTLGVPLFQEQAMQIAIVAAGFTPDEADRLRKAMAAWKRKGNLLFSFGQKLIDGMIANGYPKEFADRCFEQIKGFSEYGFPESHAASFAILVYVSCWLKRYHPAAFAAALINSQPMGFYAPAQIVRDAREHGVPVHEVDVNHSRWDCTLEPTPDQPMPLREALRARNASQWGVSGPAVRLGMRLTKGLPRLDADRISAAVQACGRFHAVEALWRVSGASTRALRCLAQADGFGSMALSRQGALWQIRPLRDDPLPLFAAGTYADTQVGDLEEPVPQLPEISPERQMLGDYASTGLSLKAHPLSFLRSHLDACGAISCCSLRDPQESPQTRVVQVAGVVLVRQRPATASGVVFITLEDETGIANLVIWPKVYEQFRSIIRLSTMLLVRGRVERQGEVVHIHADRFESLDDRAPELSVHSRDFH